MSERAPRTKAVRFVDVSSDAELPAWLAQDRATSHTPVGNDNRIQTLRPPELKHEKQYKLAPVLESLLPPAVSRPPPAPPPQEFSNDPTISIPPPPALPSTRKPDTLIEELVPRVEEEVFACIVSAVERFVGERQTQLASAEDDLVAIVRVVSQRVIAREIALDPSICRALVHEGLSALGEADQISVRLGPFFADAVHELQFDLEQKGINASVRVDPDVGPHGCTIETELGHVDESVQLRLDRLLGDLSSGARPSQ